MTAIRELTPLEQSKSWLVFRSSVDFTTVRIADDVGLQSRPWCSPPGWGGLPYFCLHMGPARFQLDLGTTQTSLLIHEMTHVWQGQHNAPLWYVFNSGCNQAVATVSGGSSGGAYAIDSQTGQWKDYGAEQQAVIVQGWFAGGMSSSDWRFRFIRDNVRTGSPLAFSQDAKPPAWTQLQPAHGGLVAATQINMSRRF